MHDPKADPFHAHDHSLKLVAWNVSSRYAAIIVEMVIGLLMLPFNIGHLGQSAYGLWLLSASLTTHFNILDLGFGGSLLKFTAQFRARRDVLALNEAVSTMFVLFAGVGLLAYSGALIVAHHLDFFFALTPDQAETGKWVVMIVAIPVALNFPFSVYGGVVGGFQRYHINSTVAIATSLCVAAANVAVLQAGYGLIELVMATTSVRVVSYFAYRLNAHRIFPALHVRPSLFRRHRIRELTSFGIYWAMIDWANRLNYSLDALVAGAFLGPAAVAVWAVAERLIHGTQVLTNQLNGVLFPVVVDSDALERRERLQRVLIEGTRFSLAMVLPVAMGLVTLSGPLIYAWVGRKEPNLMGSVIVVQILAFSVATRVGNATASVILKGAGEHKMLAWTNILTGVVNIGLSMLLVQWYGLAGIAIGTLIPVATSATLVIFPAACRRVGLPVRHLVARAVWPAAWPALVVFGLLAVARGVIEQTLLSVAITGALAALLYVALFFGLALQRRDRELYTTKALEILGRRPLPSAV
ncbi:MAG: oligosaccharide flippase family protein [Vicinamibacterales bacterium]